ncbi:GNAT family N-acetyltransferase [Paenibacillus xylanilyticus]|uniref:GNAT family N-acetyltransferase n=1 Tax=Paenibacillus xylanilyticus TaxID=248903 RepID=A0A7Y6EXB6_9BACL|nr:GNAT family N-acetyltransferase [Paenibacillus xylanilyticus]NUU77633.1 GNAT family N-acetyltransferase [Paenibacillus xylanilyticus]
MKQLPAEWKSDRLVISNVQEFEIPELQSICDSSRYLQQWDGREHDPDYVKKCFEEGNLPPGGMLENYRIQSIRTAKDHRKIGLLSLYHGYPSADSVYLEFIYIQSEIQKQGYGQEMIHALTHNLSELGYKEIRINVALKNWPALRFWIKSGFDQISGIYGDLEHSDTTFANTELIKTL